MVRVELKGTPVSPGVGIGPAFVVVASEHEKIAKREILSGQVDAALEHFEQARSAAIRTLQKIQSAAAIELGTTDAAIYGAQIAVLQDPDALQEIHRLVREEHYAPESAIQGLIDKFESLFESMEGGTVKNWAADLRDPWFNVIRELNQEEEDLFAVGEGRMILVAQELTPSLVARHRNHPLAGILCARGGRYSHGAVLARAFGIPTVVGLEQVHIKARNGEACVVYGDDGRVYLGAGEDLQADALRFAHERQVVNDHLQQASLQECRMACGQVIQILANIESPRDLEMFDPAIADGVGLFRTEFAYMERPTFPGEKEQTQIYQTILEKFPNKPVIFRTLDVGGDKPLRYFTMPVEANPTLGWRGLRVSLEWKDLFLMQLSAIVQARNVGDARIMLPMVSNVEEVREAKELVDQLRADAPERLRRVPLGVMVEVPAAAMALKDIAAEVDFISVGTNDLTQYLFAVDRDNAWVSKLYQPYHPAHLRVLQYISKTCDSIGKNLSVCGEMAGQITGALFLVGSNYRSLSMAPPFVPQIKAILRHTKLADLQGLAQEASACHSSEDALAILEKAAANYWQQVVQGAKT